MKTLFVIMMLVLVSAVGAQATPWQQGWTEIGDVEKVEGFIVAGAVDFQPPGIGNFLPVAEAAGWTGTLVNPDYILASGPERSSLMWTTWFSDQSPFTLDWLLYDAERLTAGVRFDWTGDTWLSGPIPCGMQYDRSDPAAPVPESGTLALVGLGFAMILLFISRRRDAMFTA